MFYGRVTGTVVCTVKDEKLEGKKLLVVQRTNYAMEDEGDMIVALDAVQAGVGDFVFLSKGKEASLPFGSLDYPVDATVTGIIDRTNINPEA